MAIHKETGACPVYLDGAENIEGALYTRRSVVLAVEDLRQQIEAPSSLQSEASAQMRQLKLNPVPELKLYSEVATAILRMDTALHLSCRGRPIQGTQCSAGA